MTVILLLLLSMVTTPPPRLPALPFTLILSCRNCSYKRGMPPLSRGHHLLPDKASPARSRPAFQLITGAGEEREVLLCLGKSRPKVPSGRPGACQCLPQLIPPAHPDLHLSEVLNSKCTRRVR